jgi:CRP/FNR family transcriptional regulator, nitrogen oxide reductase regulator
MLVMTSDPASHNLVDLLRAIPLFKSAADEDLRPLSTECRFDSFAPGEIIFYAGDPTNRLWIVRLGQVKIIRYDETGREVVPEIIPPGEAFGGATIFFTRQPATAQALMETEIVSFPAERYAEFLLAHPPIALNFIRMLGARLQSVMMTNMLAGERVERRVAHILLKLANRSGRADAEGVLITIPLSRQDLADMSGTTLETTIRIMSRFRSDGLVKTRRGGYIVIQDRERLQQLART